jgi:predicted  nucleic acid-binding Zn-ribbon protein
MDCPDCGSRLSAYVLGDREALACERCAWTGIEADHRGEGSTAESWDEALDRFHARRDVDEAADDADPGAVASSDRERRNGTSADPDGRASDGES